MKNFLNYAFIHIPKTAGTSITMKLTKYGVKTLGNHLTAEQILKIYPNIKLFTCIRNPFDRFISAYNFYKTKNIWSNQKFNIISNITYTQEDVLSLLLDNKFNFIHFWKQVYWLNTNKEILYLRYETLDQDFYKMFGIKLDIRLNVTKKIETSLSKESVSKILEFYKDDFTFLKYPTSYANV